MISWHTTPPRLLLLLLALAAGAAAQADQQPDPLFLSDTTLRVRLVSELDTIVSERPNEEYLPGKLSYVAEDGNTVELDVGIRTRGNFRRREDVCPFPPLRLNFKKKQVKGTVFDGQDKIKLVTHCNPSSYIYEQAVVAEYLAYRVLNLLTDFSFRVRLIRVEYAHADDDKGFETFAFMIEHARRLAKRTGIPELEVDKTDFSNLDWQHQNLMSVYQFFLGNTDFSPVRVSGNNDCCHNYALFGNPDELPYFAVPYDFDMSGFVNPPHAAPNPALKIDSVRDRLYRGRCSTNDFLPGSFETFMERRQEITDLVNGQEELGARTRRDLMKFIDGFYRTISSERRTSREIIRRCR